jgi:protein-disulfide isomerase
MAEDTNKSPEPKVHKSTPTTPFIERYMTPIAILLGLIIIAVAITFGHNLQPATQPAAATGQPAATAVNIANVKTADEAYVGNANAPVTMALFFDYQCPFCKQFDQTVLNQLYTNYIATGKLKVVFKDFDFIGPDSTIAAEYGRAIWQTYPNSYYPWLTAMFAAQDEENTGFGDAPSIQKLTATIPGINVATVEALVAKNQSTYDAEISADRNEGASYGIQGTPSVIVGTTLLQGAQTYATVAALVDAQLKAK